MECGNGVGWECDESRIIPLRIQECVSVFSYIAIVQGCWVKILVILELGIEDCIKPVEKISRGRWGEWWKGGDSCYIRSYPQNIIFWQSKGFLGEEGGISFLVTF